MMLDFPAKNGKLVVQKVQQRGKNSAPGGEKP